MAVHSAKDLPARLRRRVAIEAYPRRADPRDCLVAQNFQKFHDLPRGARLGSSSLRRQAQLLRWRPDLRVVPIRGNVDSRLKRVASGELDGVILAAAGVKRLGHSWRITEILDRRRLLPAPGQGALAVQVRQDDRRTARIVRRIDHGSTRAAVTSERAFAAALGGDCNLPLGALATVRNGRLRIVGEVLSPDGKVRLRAATEGSARSALRIGSELGEKLRRLGATRLMQTPR